ncbi:hypothetical protein [Chitinophaga sp.]|uniref:hypothetical protein n=1 Tax=Chitinophaga sp. TaxID=1869181 RepID=UPI0031D756A1
MSHNNQSQNDLPVKGSLSQIFASLNLITASIEARICITCGWDDDDLEYFCRHTDEIPEAQKHQINNIITSELAKRLIAAPAIPTNIHISNSPEISH